MSPLRKGQWLCTLGDGKFRQIYDVRYKEDGVSVRLTGSTFWHNTESLERFFRVLTPLEEAML